MCESRRTPLPDAKDPKDTHIDIFYLLDNEAILAAHPDWQQHALDRVYQKNLNFNGTIRFLNLKTEQAAVQLAKMFGVSDARSKRYRSLARKCGFIDKHCEPKYSTLDWRMLSSIFIAIYCRIGGLKVLSSVDLIAEHEAYTAIVRGIEAAPVLKARFWPYLQGNDNFVQLAMEYRQGHLCLDFCDICKCSYVKTYDTSEKTFTGGCSFCEFRDTFVFRIPTGA